MVYSSTGINTHSTPLGYLFWLFGFMGAHRFYYGKPWSGTLWFCTFGLFSIGWIIDFFLIPSMDREADLTYKSGPYNFTLTWILLIFLGVFGVHRFYLGKWPTGILWLCTGGFFLMGYLWDLWNLNDLISERNSLA